MLLTVPPLNNVAVFALARDKGSRIRVCLLWARFNMTARLLGLGRVEAGPQSD